MHHVMIFQSQGCLREIIDSQGKLTRAVASLDCIVKLEGSDAYLAGFHSGHSHHVHATGQLYALPGVGIIAGA